jgi:alkanesulfonate monooxygenase SsuD/methylene tetrahydromethanopterin reductase-like flavin-dependent oxidoreductase (luciferase family)
LAEHVTRYRHAFRAAAHQRDAANVAIACPAYVADSAAQVRREVEASFLNYFQAISLQARLGARDNSPGYDYLREIGKRVEAVTWEQIEPTALYGSPEICVRKIQALYAQCRMDQVICWFNPGGLVPHPHVLTSMRRFAEEVMPAVHSFSALLPADHS